jgi:hypothetical protein
MRKDARVNIRLSTADLEMLKGRCGKGASLSKPDCERPPQIRQRQHPVWKQGGDEPQRRKAETVAGSDGFF